MPRARGGEFISPPLTKAIQTMAEKRKSFPLRISNEVYVDLRRWADDEMRSVNAQIEYILREAIKVRKKGSHSSTKAEDSDSSGTS